MTEINATPPQPGASNDGEADPLPLLQRGAARLGIPLSPRQLDAFRVYRRELVAWNARTNLTRIVGPEEVQTRHFVDSLTVVKALPPETLNSGRVMDVGAGAGFPGLPLKICFPGLRLTLVEAVGKKAAFLNHMVETLGLAGVEVCHERAETLAREPGRRDGYDAVLSRGVVKLRVLAEFALPFCRVGGVVATHKKGDIAQELRDAERAVGLLGGRLAPTVPVSVEGLDDDRVIVTLAKIAPTPDRYPRRPGMPKKRPL